MSLLTVLAVVYSCLFIPTPDGFKQRLIPVQIGASGIPPIYPSLDDIKAMLNKESATLSQPVIDKVLTTLKCSTAYNVDRNILTIIDYSLPSNQKRLWVFDLKDKKLLFYTFVSHGIKSGTLLTSYFSNKYNSRATSMGVYKTEQAYYGREGLSLRLAGLDKSFNDNANNRSIVMHGGWYVDEQFIKRYGRPGRSWGCPALPLSMYKSIISTIKDNSLMVAYYPSDTWFVKSRFLNCGKPVVKNGVVTVENPVKSTMINSEMREDVLFADTRNNNKQVDDSPILVMSADDYEKIFHTQAPLDRMLRRKVSGREFIALSGGEFKRLVLHSSENNKVDLNAVYFVVPVLKMVRGYYETEMKIVDFGKIKDVQLNTDLSNQQGRVKSYMVSFEGRPVLNLKPTNHFIRWVGL